jgi:hypothetical protein
LMPTASARDCRRRLSRIPTCWRSAAGTVASMTMPGSSASVSNPAVAVAPATAYRVRIDFKPDGWIDREVVDAIIADNVKAELTLS